MHYTELDLDSTLARLELSIFGQLGRDFDPDNRSQTRQALFRVGIRCDGSDNALEQLRGHYRFVDEILEYRRIKKMEEKQMIEHPNKELETLANHIYEVAGGKAFDIFDNAACDQAFKRAFDIDLGSEKSPEYLTNLAYINSAAGAYAKDICVYREKCFEATRTNSIAQRVFELHNTGY